MIVAGLPASPDAAQAWSMRLFTVRFRLRDEIYRALRRASLTLCGVWAERYPASQVRPAVTLADLPALSPDAKVRRRFGWRRRWTIEQRLEMVEYIRGLYDMGAAYPMIATHLNAQGLRTQLGRLWNDQSVYYYKTVPDRRVPPP
jgi:hypothetical protein